MEKTVAVEMKGITKRFGRIIANHNANLTVLRGEILAILGENGSGKTTLMNMLAGIYYPDEGKIYVDGKEAVISSPRDAYRYKIGMVHQHFKLVDVFTAAENITLGMEDGDSRFDIRNVNANVKAIADKYGFVIDRQKKIYEMSVSEKQTVEIIKVLYRGADILILDEPTAVLTPQETERLFSVIRAMKKDGKAVIIITHKLHEVLSVSDRVAILRHGEHVDTVITSETNEAALTEMMVGRKVNLNIERTEPVNPQPRLIVDHVCKKDVDGNNILSDITFTVHSGEILGIAGIAGSGQKELLETIAGLIVPDSGTLTFNRPKKDLPVSFFHKSYAQIVEMAKEGKFHYKNGSKVNLAGMRKKQIRQLVNEGKILFNDDDVVNLKEKNPRQIREMGVHLSFVPEDRLGMGLVGDMDITDNMLLRSYRKGFGLFLHKENSKDLAKKIIKDLEVVTPGVSTPVRRLSGGNVQKVLVGREISTSPKVLMAAYPVRGLDINSSYLIYNLLNQQKKEGTAVIFVGEDLDVLMELCDRILVMNCGRITGIVDGRSVKKEDLGLLMTKGVNND